MDRRNDGMLTVKDAAGKLGVSESLVYSWCSSGRLAHFRLGGRKRGSAIRIAPADLDAFMASCRQEATQDKSPVPPPPVGDGFPAFYQQIMEEVARKRRN